MVDQQDVPLGVALGKPLEEAAVQELAADFRGELIRRDDDGYDAAHAAFNGMID
jgi:FAD/FMN-containing dehydrogenase